MTVRIIGSGWRYFLITIRHKWFILLASFQVDLPLWRAVVHDLSKFTLAELPHYDRQFFGDKGDPAGFAQAWLHHQNKNPHHWEYWITRSDHSHGGSGAVDGCLPMPRVFVTEMIADWMGASKAYTGEWDMTDWLGKSLIKIKVHPDTEADVDASLLTLGYKIIRDKFANSCSVMRVQD